MVVTKIWFWVLHESSLKTELEYPFEAAGSCSSLRPMTQRAGEPHQMGLFQQDKGV